MPLAFGIPDLVRAEVDRFTEGLGDLAEGAESRARAAAAYERPGSSVPRAIVIPGWDDVIHIRPKVQISAEERGLHYAALKAGKPSVLSGEKVQQLETNRARARAMRQSASPEYAKAYGQVLTAIDNVQDLTTTIAVAGRITVNPAMRALDALGAGGREAAAREAGHAAARAAAAGVSRTLSTEGTLGLTAALREQFLRTFITTGRTAAVSAVERTAATAAFDYTFSRAARGLGTFLLGRAIPVIGWVLLAGDLLKLLNIIGIWAFPFFALACRGTLAGAAATVPALLIGSALCARIGKWAESSPFGRRARLRRSLVARAWKPSIYNLMEVAQTTDALYGRGVAFGGLVGMVQDAAFGAAQQAQGRQIRVELGAYRGSATRLYQDAATELSAAALHVHRVAASVLAYGPVIARTQEDFTAEEHMVAMCAYSAALGYLRPWIERPETVEAMNLALEESWPPPSYLADRVAAEILDGGIADRDSFGVWPLPGNPRTITGQQMLDLGDECTAGLRRLLEPRRDEIEGAFMGALACRIMERCALLFAGNADAWQFQVEAPMQIMATLARRNRLVNTSADEADVQRAFDAGAAWMEANDRREIPDAVLDQLFRGAGVPLLQLVAPDVWEAQR